VFIGQSVTPGNVQTSEQAASKRSDTTGSAPDGAPRKRKKK
jgi:ribonuclease R